MQNFNFQKESIRNSTLYMMPVDRILIGQHLLVVFVHGFRATAESTWGSMPQWCADKAGVAMDILCYNYDTSWDSSTGVKSIANDLKQLLEEIVRLNRYSRIAFITHSTGGLVVKALLLQDVKVIGETQRNFFGRLSLFRTSRTNPLSRQNDVKIGKIALRTRVIVNLAVPHSGANWSMTFLLAVLAMANGCNLPRAWLTNLLAEPAHPKGTNLLHFQLAFVFRYARQQEIRFCHLMHHLNKAAIPRPARFEVLASDDPVIRLYQVAKRQVVVQDSISLLSDEDEVFTFATHGTVPLPKTPKDPIVSIIANRISALRVRPELVIAEQTFQRCLEVDNAEGSQSLVGSAVFNSLPYEHDAAVLARAGTQLAVFDQICELIFSANRSSPQHIVITGSAGVGKSFVLRRIAREAAIAELRNCYDVDDSRNCRIPLPVMIPLQQFDTQGDRGTLVAQFRNCLKSDLSRAWQAASAYWCDWITQLYEESHAQTRDASAAVADEYKILELTWLTSDWLAAWIAHSPTVVILDGVDEFLMKFPDVKIGQLAAFVEQIKSIPTEQGRNNPFITVILGVRRSQPNIERLYGSERHALEIVPLTIEQAEYMFPGCDRLIRRIRRRDSRALLLTPLVLSELGPQLTRIDNEQLQTRAGILHVALDVLVERSLRGCDDFAVYTSEQRVAALMLMSWLFFRDKLGKNVDVQLKKGLDSLQEQWMSNGTVVSERIATAFDILENDQRRMILWVRSIFLPIGSKSFRFRHREWEDFLAGLYLAECLRYRRLGDLSLRIFNKDIYLVAGESLNRDNPREQVDVQHFAETQKWPEGQKRTCSIANLIALIGNSNLPIERRVLRCMCDAITFGTSKDKLTIKSPDGRTIEFRLSLELLPRILGMNALIRRGLTNSKNDISAPDLLRTMNECLLQYLQVEESKSNGILRSMVWCYRNVLASVDQAVHSTPEQSWPGYGSDEDALDFVTEMDNGNRMIGDLSGTTQLAWANHAQSAYEGKHEVVAMLHYAYPLAVGISRGFVEADIADSFRKSFVDSPEVLESIKSYRFLPNVEKMLKAVTDKLN